MKMQSIARASRDSQSGFSLVELLTVVVIIAILLAMSLMLPEYGDFRDRIACKGFATSVLTKFREAKNLSKAFGKDASILVDLDNEQVWLEVNNDSYGAMLTAPSKCKILGFQRWTSSPDTVTTGIRMVTFYNRGTSIAQSLNGPDGILHIGTSSDVYASGDSNSVSLKTIIILNAPGRAEMFDVGCVGTDAWNTSWGWPLCRRLKN